MTLQTEESKNHPKSRTLQYKKTAVFLDSNNAIISKQIYDKD